MATDVVIIGSGPNGLAAAVMLAGAGASVLVLEAQREIGGATGTRALTLPGFRHDHCSAVHPLGILSPYLRSLPLAEHGLRWLAGAASVAHPLDEAPAVILEKSLEATADGLGIDARAYRELVAPLLEDPHGLLADVLAPPRVPRHPRAMLRFARYALRSATGLAARFYAPRARALLAGCAAHSMLPLDRMLSGAVGLLFLVTAHVETWPVAAGGSQAIATALASLLRELGGRIETGFEVRSRTDLPAARAYLFDTSPAQLARIAGDVLPSRARHRLARHRYGPAAYKVDWALTGPIPWRDPRCATASTVHLGGTLEEIAAAEAAVWRRAAPARPFVLVCQQSQLDPTRAPRGMHTGYAYCHVPAGSRVDMTARIEQQLERFAPGFRTRILARHVTRPADFARDNANLVGGAITGGTGSFAQLLAQAATRPSPYATPHPRIFLCSSSTPPGAGVHGMCGYHAAEAVLEQLPRLHCETL